MPIQYGNSTHFSYLCHDIDPKGNIFGPPYVLYQENMKINLDPNEGNKNRTKI